VLELPITFAIISVRKVDVVKENTNDEISRTWRKGKGEGEEEEDALLVIKDTRTDFETVFRTNVHDFGDLSFR
jgi:hypothetical protein